MAKEYHPLVMLMLARIKSHPEEFEVERGRTNLSKRWCRVLQDIDEYACEEGKRLVSEAVNAVRMDQAHRDAMDELLNGDDHRAKVEADLVAEETAIRAAIPYPTAGIGNLAPGTGATKSSIMQQYQNVRLSPMASKLSNE